MSWANLHIERDDDIRPSTSQIRGYAQVYLGESSLMMPTAKAEELHAVLGELLAGQSNEDGAR